MKGPLTERQIDEMMADANFRDERNRGHAWWVRTTAPQRRGMLARYVSAICRGEDVPPLSLAHL